MINLSEEPRIRRMDYITKEEYEEINRLCKLCCEQDKINLKLELDYKLHLASLKELNTAKVSSDLNEFLYYTGEKLVSYLGISCFDGITGEITGMTHPAFRGQGLFTRLLALARKECEHRSFRKLLLLTDGNSETGVNFTKAAGFAYEHSEYRMKRLSAQSDLPIGASAVTLRPAYREDEPEIAMMNSLFFDDAILDANTGDPVIKALADDPENFKTYMVELADVCIGKINVEFSEDYAFICGFGIRPEFRGNGYGRAALNSTLRIIEDQHIRTTELDVVCTNKRALLLYQSCGFHEISIMNYYSLPSLADN